MEGASEAEIQALEDYAGSQLPRVYKQFLRQIKRCAGPLFRGTKYSLTQPSQLRLREHAEQLLEKQEVSFKLPKNAFVFLDSQGYQFSFFPLDQGDDPPVYHYQQGEEAPMLVDSSLSQYLWRCIEAYEYPKA